MSDCHKKVDYCSDCIHLEYETWCNKVNSIVPYTTYCTLKKIKEETNSLKWIKCSNCAYLDEAEIFCYIVQGIPDPTNKYCAFLEWKVVDKVESKTDVKDLLPNQTALVVLEKKDEKKEEKKDDKKVTYSTYTKNSKCHNGTVLAFTDPKSKVDICGGGKMRDVLVKKDDLFIDVGFHYEKLIETYGLKAGWKLEQYNKTEQAIKIDWTDGGHPNLSKKFWEDLVKVIRTEKKRVVVSCQGGHGRTGTVLSILSVLMGAVKKEEDPVKFIREKYCQEAVETKTQCDYIENITGCKIAEKPSHSYGTVYSGYGGHSNYYTGMSWLEEKDKLNKQEDNKKDKVTETAIENLKSSGVYDLLMF